MKLLLHSPDKSLQTWNYDKMKNLQKSIVVRRQLHLDKRFGFLLLDNATIDF
jgi:hypothetical protein